LNDYRDHDGGVASTARLSLARVRATCTLSRGRVDGVVAAQSREDAIAATPDAEAAAALARDARTLA